MGKNTAIRIRTGIWGGGILQYPASTSQTRNCQAARKKRNNSAGSDDAASVIKEGGYANTIANYHEHYQTLIKNGTANGAASNAYLTLCPC